MAGEQNLILSLPQGTAVATSLGVEGFAWHASPGSGRHFQDRKIFFDLKLAGGGPGFQFLDEGGWRDNARDTREALAAVAGGKRTKTALSNNAFSCIPVDAMARAFLVKTGGRVMELTREAQDAARFSTHDCHEGMSPDEIAKTIGAPPQPGRAPRIYFVVAPVEFVVISSLTPVEYAWYATHRPGKVFRQVCFAELRPEHPPLAAVSVYDDALAELKAHPGKKTKTIVTQDCMNHVLFRFWKGYGNPRDGGLYLGDRNHCLVWRFPAEIPRKWERSEG